MPPSRSSAAAGDEVRAQHDRDVPVALFIGLVFWWYIWRVPGVILAVPMMATLKIACDHIESLAPIVEFLGK